MADETDDLEYSDTNVGSAQAQGVRKNISLKLKGKGRGRGRRGGKTRRSSAKKGIDDNDENADPPGDDTPSEKQFTDTNLDEVISKLDKTPAFSPMDRPFPEPMHQNKKLRWDHKVNLIGEKVMDPLIHCCEKCSLPILNYGRMIPCKHVFCLDCAKKFDKMCGKCDITVQRVEQSILGTVFMCTFGGSRHVPGACGRTYLSQRDLQAHVNHRHLKTVSSSSSSHQPISTSVTVGPSHMPVTRDPRDPRAHLQVDVSHQPIMVTGHIQHTQDHRDNIDHARSANLPLGSPVGQSRQYPHSPANYASTIPVSSARPNLITVPIQDDGGSISASAAAHMHPPQAHTAQYVAAVTPTHPIPPIQHPPTTYPPHVYQHPHPATTPAYSQAPPITTQTFSQPPPIVHHQPPINHPHAPPAAPMYANPPPGVHHPPPPPTTYTPPPHGPQHVPHTVPPPPQRFQPTASGYEDSSYLQQWPPSAVPPPPTRAPLPPRPITAPPPAPNPNVPHMPPRGPSEPPYRPPYYQ